MGYEHFDAYGRPLGRSEPQPTPADWELINQGLRERDAQNQGGRGKVEMMLRDQFLDSVKAEEQLIQDVRIREARLTGGDAGAAQYNERGELPIAAAYRRTHERFGW